MWEYNNIKTLKKLLGEFNYLFNSIWLEKLVLQLNIKNTWFTPKLKIEKFVVVVKRVCGG